MLIAATTKDNGRKMLVLGLEAENIANLLNDMPIYKSLNKDPHIPGLEEWDITILGPEDMIRFVGHYGLKVK